MNYHPSSSDHNENNSTRSRSPSIISDVWMAQEEVFDGPISESIPSSSASFVHQRDRRDSSISFTYIQPSIHATEWLEDRTSGDDRSRGNSPFENNVSDDEALLVPTSYSNGSDRRISSPPLSGPEVIDYYGSGGNRVVSTNQIIYMPTEDVTIVFRGFSTDPIGITAYYVLSFMTCGFLYLLLHWLPKWRIRLVGRQMPLDRCQWVSIEDQWGQLHIEQVITRPYSRPLSTVFNFHTTENGSMFNEGADPIVAELRHFDYRYMRFYYQPLKGGFFLNNDWKDSSWNNIRSLRCGLTADERDCRQDVFGTNLIDIRSKSASQILLDEAFHPFYIFQIASLVLWSLDEYYYYAACIFLVSIFTIGTTTHETRTTMLRLKAMSHFECTIRVLRSGFWRSIPSRELVPGDVYEVSDPSLDQVPCDCLLLSGDCIVNESMLTGESVPVTKTPAINETLASMHLTTSSMRPDVAKHFLYCGTRIIRARRPKDVEDDEAAALAVVIRTGFNTTKGALVRSMLFPKPSGFEFYQDAFRYISVMAVTAALGFMVSVANFLHLGVAWHTIVVRALDLVTIVVPPALPATLTIGTNFALSRLKRNSIFCISPQRVNIAGKLDVMCFDKTGTLTEDGLDVLGIRITRKSDKCLGDLITNTTQISLSRSYRSEVDYETGMDMLYTMATCHSLRAVNGDLIGDPLDLKMFQFTGWSYDEGNQFPVSEERQESFSLSVARPPNYSNIHYNYGNFNPKELVVLRSFEFVSQLRRSSVIAEQFGDSGINVFVKGAPESMKEICVYESLPLDFDQTLADYTHQGFRVIACATKHIKNRDKMIINRMSRSEVESELKFLGFIIFENKLKRNTKRVIEELDSAAIRNIMCTGDNILTAVSVARECGLIRQSDLCFAPHFLRGNSLDPYSRLSWECLGDYPYNLERDTLNLQSTFMDHLDPDDCLSLPNYSIAVTGEMFRWIVDYAPEEVLRRVLVKTSVFARMSPDEKHELIEKLRSLNYCCGFCGDGANDCGALKAADVGISLSDAEASVAAPFTSRIFDITCVPKLIKEGRASLVTSFCCFKYMSLYSAIQFISVSFLYASASNLGDFQFLFIDLALILPIAILMGWLGPSPTLCRARPTSNLVSSKVLISLLGQITICAVVQFICVKAVRSQKWYIPPKLDLNDTNVENSDNTVLFLISCYQYISSGVVLSTGRPFRQPVNSNFPFVTTIVIAFILCSLMLLGTSKWLSTIMQLTFLSGPFKTIIFLLAVVSCVVSLAFEKLYPLCL